MDDQGKSGYKGEHILEDSALGGFLKQLVDGSLVLSKNPKPLLVVEQIDRLTRLKPSKGKKLISLLLEYVDICVVEPSGTSYQLYADDGDDESLGSDIMLIVVIYSAYKYSANLSKRIKSAQKRSLADSVTKRVATRFGRLPFWLVRDGEYYAVVDKWGDIVKRAFDLLSKGLTSNQIADIFNDEGLEVPSSKRENDGKGVVIPDPKSVWTIARISRFFRDKRAIGEVKLKHHDAPIDLYPRIVSDATFYKVLELASGRRRNVVGKLTTVKGLLASYSYCFSCGARMHVDKRTRPSGYVDVRLRCSSVAQKTLKTRDCDCTYASREFERVFLEMVVDRLSESDVVKESRDDERETLKSKLATCENEIKEFEALLKTSNAPSLFRGLAVQEDLKKDLERQLGLLAKSQPVALKENYRRIVELANEALDPLNIEVHTMLRSIIERVEIYKSGDKNSVLLVELKSGIRRQAVKVKDKWTFIELEPLKELEATAN
ncbi:hypothetical protein HGP28_02310 [Vibrio sp. SM6]|uniref:Recombinase domain-containing protein n=1 Tax=Vibrio agarilyticus TaxID=2726741 RepID=A0A7X8TMY7_9VIBR|nr:recombinase family protein [Vibrio agarilyticus]NLS11721.1 hypothetical protein [Vibrio agarilyticus]